LRTLKEGAVLTKNIKIFFKKPESEPAITFNHYGVTELERKDSMLLVHKDNDGEDYIAAIVNWDNVNQIVEI
jgi:hypothetical protein